MDPRVPCLSGKDWKSACAAGMRADLRHITCRTRALPMLVSDAAHAFALSAFRRFSDFPLSFFCVFVRAFVFAFARAFVPASVDLCFRAFVQLRFRVMSDTPSAVPATQSRGGDAGPASPWVPHWEHFDHSADIGIRGIGRDRAQAYAQAAMALMAVIVAPGRVAARTAIAIACAPAPEPFLFLDWINALIYAMATRRMLFARFDVQVDAQGVHAQAWGEAVDVARHQPAVEPKGATLTALTVEPVAGGWLAQCVVDV